MKLLQKKKSDKLTFFSGKWVEIELLGRGSFGCVYKVRKEEFGAESICAIKRITIPQDEAYFLNLKKEGLNDTQIDHYFQQVVQKFVDEIKYMSILKDCINIVTIEDYEVTKKEKGKGYLIDIRMELLINIDDYFLKHNLSDKEALKMAIHICNALEECEKRQIVHRDIKPENIFISKAGIYKVGDFGTAKKTDANLSNMSKKGTENYMAPELYKNQKGNKTVDIYSLGIMLYKYFNFNRLPFYPNFPETIQYDDPENAIYKRISGEKIPKPLNASEEISYIILKAISYEPKERYQSATDLKNDLEKVYQNIKKPLSLEYNEKKMQKNLEKSLKESIKEHNSTYDIWKISDALPHNNDLESLEKKTSDDFNSQVPEIISNEDKGKNEIKSALKSAENIAEYSENQISKNSEKSVSENNKDEKIDEKKLPEINQNDFVKLPQEENKELPKVKTGKVKEENQIILPHMTDQNKELSSNDKISQKSLVKANQTNNEKNVIHQINQENKSQITDSITPNKNQEQLKEKIQNQKQENQESIKGNSLNQNQVKEESQNQKQKKPKEKAVKKLKDKDTKHLKSQNDSLNTAIKNPFLVKIKNNKVIIAIILLIILLILGLLIYFALPKTSDKEPQIEMVAMPYIVNKTSQDAQTILTDLGLEIEYISIEVDNQEQVGIVLEQSITSDTQISKGTLVTISIGVSKEKIPMPNIVGKTKEEAIQELEAIGLTIKFEETYNDEIPAGMIISQMTPEGEMVNLGTPISILISKGPKVEEDKKESTNKDKKDNSNSNNSSSSNNNNNNNDKQWSAWVENLPSNITDSQYEIEKRQEYRFQTRETTTSQKSSLDGWTKYGTSTSTYELKDPTIYTKVDNLNEIGPMRKDPAIKIISDTYTKNHFAIGGVCYDKATNTHVASTKHNCPAGYEHESYSFKDIPENTPAAIEGGTFERICPGHKVKATFENDWNFGPVYEIKYQKLTRIRTYNYEKWSAWSDWSTNAKSENENTKVETRTMYRYKEK